VKTQFHAGAYIAERVSGNGPLYAVVKYGCDVANQDRLTEHQLLAKNIPGYVATLGEPIGVKVARGHKYDPNKRMHEVLVTEYLDGFTLKNPLIKEIPSIQRQMCIYLLEMTVKGIFDFDVMGDNWMLVTNPETGSLEVKRIDLSLIEISRKGWVSFDDFDEYKVLGQACMKVCGLSKPSVDHFFSMNNPFQARNPFMDRINDVIWDDTLETIEGLLEEFKSGSRRRLALRLLDGAKRVSNKSSDH